MASKEHVQIADAFAAKDPEEAARQLAAHLGRSALTVTAVLSPQYEPTRVREALRVTKQGVSQSMKAVQANFHRTAERGG